VKLGIFSKGGDRAAGCGCTGSCADVPREYLRVEQACKYRVFNFGGIKGDARGLALRWTWGDGGPEYSCPLAALPMVTHAGAISFLRGLHPNAVSEACNLLFGARAGFVRSFVEGMSYDANISALLSRGLAIDTAAVILDTLIQDRVIVCRGDTMHYWGPRAPVKRAEYERWLSEPSPESEYWKAFYPVR